MKMVKWAVKNDTKNKVLATFNTVDEGIDYTFQLIAEKFSNIESIVDNTLQLITKNIEKNANDIDECDDYYDLYEDEMLKKHYDLYEDEMLKKHYDLCKEAIEQFRDFSKFRSSKIIELIEHHDA